jgi:hypothetical protein
MAYSPAIVIPANGQFLNPNMVSGVGNTQAFNSVYDAFVINEWFTRKTRNNQNLNFSQYLQATGAVRGNNSPTTGHYEVGKLTENLYLGQIIAVTNPQNVIVELSASSMLNQVGVIQSFPQVYQRGITQGSKLPFWISAKNSAVNPHQVTLTAVNVADDISAELAAGQRLFLPYGTGVEASGFRKPVTRRFTRYTNTFERVITAPTSTTDLAATDKYRFEDDKGNAVAFAIDNADLDLRHQFEKSNALIFGTTANNITETIAGLGQTLSNPGAQGMISFMDDYAFTLNYANVNYFLFERMVNIFSKEQTVSTSFECFNGIDFQQAAQSALADYGRELFTDKLPLLSYKEEDNVEGLFLKAGAFGFKMNGYDFRFIELPNLSDNTQGGTPGYDYSWYSMVVPVGVFRNGEDGNSYPAVMMEHKQTDMLSLNNHVRIKDGIGLYGNVVTGDEAITLQQLQSDICLHMSCGNNMMILKKI